MADEQDIQSSPGVANVYHDYTPYGTQKNLFGCRDPEVLLDGPAGSGKSRCAGEYINWICETYPRCRILVCRKTRASLSESFMVTFEEKVLWPSHPALNPALKRTNRTSYIYPSGSTIVLGGMDYKTRLFSTEYDVCFVNEATELTEEEWESIHRALRNGVVPWQQLVGDCNPAHEGHWLNQRCISHARKPSQCTRLKIWHEDNPTLSGEYLSRLQDNLTGVMKDRLFYGKWVTAEGAIWPDYKENVHLLSSKVSQRKTGEWKIIKNASQHTGPEIDLRWFFAGVDWGYEAAGSILVFGVDKDDIVYMVEEVYHTHQLKEWWAEKAVELQKKYDILRFVCDSAEPDDIALFNSRMGQKGGDWIAKPFSKKKGSFRYSSDTVGEMLRQKRLFILRGALQEADPELVRKHRPTCLEKEIPGYIYREKKDDQNYKEEPAPGTPDHACDALRYALSYFFGTKQRNWSPDEPESEFPPGSYGRMMGHDTVNFGW